MYAFPTTAVQHSEKEKVDISAFYCTSIKKNLLHSEQTNIKKMPQRRATLIAESWMKNEKSTGAKQ